MAKVQLPENIMQQLKFFCDANKLGFSQVVTTEFNLLLMGNVDLHVNEVSLLAAHTLLGGVLTGAFDGLNEETKKVEEKKAENENIPH